VQAVEEVVLAQQLLVQAAVEEVVLAQRLLVQAAVEEVVLPVSQPQV